jgi:hypothetical protein
MATITYTKQYEFCDDIKTHILSFLKARKMKTFIPSPELLQKLKNWRFSFNPDYSYKTPLYHIRMEMPYRQLEYEVSSMGGLANYNKGRNYLGTPYERAEVVYIEAIASIGVYKSGLQPHLDNIRRTAKIFKYRRDECEKYIKYKQRKCCSRCNKTMTRAKYHMTDHKNTNCKLKPKKPSTKTYSVAETYNRELIECVKCYEQFQRKSMASHYEKCVLKPDKYVMGRPPTHTLW